jgi:hypothetical protein
MPLAMAEVAYMTFDLLVVRSRQIVPSSWARVSLTDVRARSDRLAC